VLYHEAGIVLIPDWRRSLSERTARFLALCIMLLLAPMGESATYRRVSLDCLIKSSDYVVYGRVLQSRFLSDAVTGVIWTQTDIRVLDGLKGQPGPSVTITEPGGVRDGIAELYPGLPRFRPDEELVLFLYRTSQNRLRVTGAMQGFYYVRSDAQTGERWAQAVGSRTEVVYDEEGFASGRQAMARFNGKEKLSCFLHDIRQKVATR
jgi:hypothetical protein